MTMIDKPLRSVLYMPGSNQRAMDKACLLPADAIVFDLEDAVAPEAKSAARAAVIAQLARADYGERLLVIRCNALETPWGEADVRAIAESGVSTVCLPKVESVAQLEQIQELLVQAGRSDVAVWAMIETARGVELAASIAAHPALTALVMGTTDLASELRVPHRADRLGLQYALGRVVMAARLSEKPVFDGVYLDITDTAGFRAVCEQGRALGFDGKTLIHPTQIQSANEVFGYSPEDVARAQRLLAVWDAAQSEGKGVAVLEGKLVESMHVREAQRILALSRAHSSDGG